ncbi:phenylalanyl-tRNA synthetase, alpha subunit [Abditibacterium utsteinense]|uniref:Phenylalanine--tRNA ligase alpha subunit n=1 Tax=Abditibacterium utsteinense TaxID=1960156 RepID=A0A2S8SQB7_9BACT|nr:phenylalanine--tRNA ligase subunit alpha [Abditibacterium utsteinense]PQV62990.1 phenylalanyl-tRNA synthetase, alpha subunit [Abditibacterium utsteinense]
MSELETRLQLLETQTLSAISNLSTSSEVEATRVAFFGKKSELTQILRGMGGLSTEERPRIGQLVNDLKARLESAFESQKIKIESTELESKLGAETIDVTLPAPDIHFGRRHPLTQTLDDIVRIFSNLGFSVVEGPEVENVYYNFDALNIGPDHPARYERDTLYVSDDVVLRTETSSVQIRVLENRKPPVKIIAPGRVYRREAVDRTHGAMFQQVEGLCVAENVTFGDLKGTLSTFLAQLFEAAPGSGAVQSRFRPHFFPFTEPSAEFDVLFKGKWLELGGCGMVHPKVLENVGVDPEKYSGFAFGFGIERLAMIKFGIDDLRLFYENDLRFLEQF